MNFIKQINIPEPCAQTWEKMTDYENGRFCESCNKTVIDFTVMTNQQIIDYLSGNNKACGKFNPGQIAQINSHLTGSAELQQVSFFKKSMVFVSLLLATYYAKAQTAVVKPRTEQTPNVLTLGKVITSQDTTTYHTVTGKVVDAQDKQPIMGAIIKAEGINITAVSDSLGIYSIRVPTNTKNLSVSFIGYESQSVCVSNVNSTQLHRMDIALMSGLLGDVVIIKAPFYKRWYYRFIKKPLKSIFG